MLKQLIWKQWKEQGWRIVFGTVVLAGVTTIGMRSRVVPDQIFLVIDFILGGFIFPVFMAMGLVAPHRTDRSLESLLALPAATWSLFAITAMTGVVGCILPFMGAGLAAVLVGQGRELGARELVLFFAGFPIFASILMYFTLCFSIRVRHEGGVALVGIILVVLGAGTALGAINLIPTLEDNRNHVIWLVHPMGIGTLTMSYQSLSVKQSLAISARFLAVQGLIAIALGWWAVQRLRGNSIRAEARELAGRLWELLNRI